MNKETIRKRINRVLINLRLEDGGWQRYHKCTLTHLQLLFFFFFLAHSHTSLIEIHLTLFLAQCPASTVTLDPTQPGSDLVDEQGHNVRRIVCRLCDCSILEPGKGTLVKIDVSPPLYNSAPFQLCNACLAHFFFFFLDTIA